METADDIFRNELEARLQADPDDLEALFQLALRRVVDRDYETAMDLLLELMRKDRGYGDDAGRRGLLQVFELLGDDPRVGAYRRRAGTRSTEEQKWPRESFTGLRERLGALRGDRTELDREMHERDAEVSRSLREIG